MPQPDTSNQTSLSSNLVCRVPTSWLFVVSLDAWMCMYVCVYKVYKRSGNESDSEVTGPSRTTPRRLDRRKRLPCGWTVENSYSGCWTVDSGSPEASSSRAAPHKLDRESGSLAAMMTKPDTEFRALLADYLQCPDSHLHIKVIRVQHQANNCGVFDIALVASLLDGEDPTQPVHHQPLRKHFQNCRF